MLPTEAIRARSTWQISRSIYASDGSIRCALFEQRGGDRAQYGTRVPDVISIRLTREGVEGVASGEHSMRSDFHQEPARLRGVLSEGPISPNAIIW